MKTTSSTSQLVVRNLAVKVDNKPILHSVNVVANSGDLLAIMGPTGSGKTTLLNSVAGRVKATSGEITLNGRSFNKQLRRRLGYVLQDDVFMSRLTLYETLYFTVMIRISESVSIVEKHKRIHEIVDAFDLNKCLHTVIGDMFDRGLSGGEKKRANIACELLIDPDIMLIDEPTSGLDSSTAHSLMEQLRNYATDYNKTIIATIHQPSSQVYHLFSTLLLLMDGNVAYFGKAYDALTYFEDIGFPCAIHFNPADFLLGLLKSDENTRKKILNETESNSNVISGSAMENGKHVQYNLSSAESSYSNISVLGFKKSDSTKSFIDICTVDVDKIDEIPTVHQSWPTSFWTQYKMLTWRQFRQSSGHILNKFDVISALFISIIGGIVYFQSELSYRTLRDRMGLIFFCSAFWGFNCVITTVTSFPAERGVFYKERNARSYRLSAYYLAKITSDMPLILFIPVIYLCIIYWMAAVGDVGLFVLFIGVILLHCMLAQSVGHLLGAAITDIKLGIIAANTYMIFSLLLSGYFNPHLPPWMSWGKYLSIIHYPFASLNILSTQDMPILWCNITSTEVFPSCGGNTTYLNKDEVLKDFGIDIPYFCYIASMAILFIVLRIIGYYVLKVKR